MARTRAIKPGFFSNDVLAECSPLSRLLFVGLWTIADREGRLEDRPKKIKAEILPYDHVEGETLLVELAAGDFIDRYEFQGCKYIQILTFAEHQNPHQNEQASVIPPKGGYTKAASTCDQGDDNSGLNSILEPELEKELRSVPVTAKARKPAASTSGKSGSGSGSFQSSIGSGSVRIGSFDVAPHLQDEDWREMLHLAPGWDRNVVIKKFNSWVDGLPEKPRKPRAAFVGWMKKNQSWLSKPP